MSAPSYETLLESLHAQARQTFSYALEASSIPAAFDRHLHFENRLLVRHPVANWKSIPVPLDNFKKILVIALGKAALPMLDTLMERLPRKLRVRGVCCAPSRPEHRHRTIRYYAGGHPFPNEDSFRAAQATLRLLHGAGKDTFIFFLISGGASALFELPLDKRITLEDTIAYHQALVGSGATITEINTVRKHFSAVKGGRLAVAAPEAAKFSLLVSDVPTRHLDALASAPTLPDHSTIEDCRAILDRYKLLDRFPPNVRAFFADPQLPETPGDKQTRLAAGLIPEKEDPRLQKKIFSKADTPAAKGRVIPGFAHSQLDTLLSNHDLVNAARDHAQSLGMKVVIDNTCDDWDYREAARYLLTRFHQLRKEHPRICLLSGGEVTVRLENKPGTGGRNQQFILACALELAGQSVLAPANGGHSLAAEPGASIAILSAGSDGVDGNSLAAGAISDPTTITRAQAHRFDPVEQLQRFDACPLFTALGDAVVTGPTHNNLRDLRILLQV